MKKNNVRILWIIGCILLSGIIVTATARLVFGSGQGIFHNMLSMKSGAFYNGQPVDYQTEHTETVALDAVKNIRTETLYGDVSLVPSDRFELEYHYFGEIYTPHYEMKDGVLHFWDEKKSYSGNGLTGLVYNNVTIPDNTVTIRYPADSTFGEVLMDTNNGNFTLTGVRTGKLTVNNDYGEITLDNSGIESYQSDHIEITMNNGEISLKNVQAQTLSLSDDYGSAKLENCGAGMFSLSMDNGEAEINQMQVTKADMKNDYGSIELTDFTTDALQIVMNNGDILLDKVNGGAVEFTNDYGSIKANDFISSGLNVTANNGNIEIAGNFAGTNIINNEYGSVKLATAGKRADYGMNLKAGYGDIRLDGDLLKDEDGDEIDRLTENESAANTIKIKCANGDINLIFAQ